MDSQPLPVLGGKEREYIIGESIYMTEYNLCIRDKELEFRLRGFIENGKLIEKNLERVLLKAGGDVKQPVHNPAAFKRFDGVAQEHILSFPQRLVMDEDRGDNPFVV